MMMPFLGMVVAALLADTAHPAPPSDLTWYTQIGFWHYQKDTISGHSFIFHNTNLDGVKSGQATAKVRLNKGFEGLRTFGSRMTLGPAPASAGPLVQSRKSTYYFLIEKDKKRNFLEICRLNKTEMSSIFIAPVSVTDTVALRIFVKKDSLVIFGGKTTASLPRPADFSGTQWIGFECPQGTVKIFEAMVESNSGEMKETFDHAELLNLHLEKMFSPAK
jgi:hypothetical protein